MPDQTDRSSTAGFFLRVLAALVLVNLGTAVVLIYIAYTFSTDSLTRQAQESISQQVSVFAESLEDRLQSLHKTIKALESSQDMDDYLYGSEAERLILARRIERRFIQVQKDNSDIAGILFYDERGNVDIGVRNRQRLVIPRGSNYVDTDEHRLEAGQLFEKLQDTLLILSSGNMEWFIPEREASMAGPFRGEDGSYSILIGLAKLDISSGLFGGMVMMKFNLDSWFQDLAAIRIQDQSPVWVFSAANEVILRPDSSNSFSEIMDIASLIPADRFWNTQLMQSDNGLVAFRDIPLLNKERSIRLAFGLPRQALLQDLNPAIEFFTWVLVASLILLIGVSYFISNFLVGPFIELAVAQNKLVTAQRLAKLGHWEWDRSCSRIRLSENAIEILRLDGEASQLDAYQFLEKVHQDDRGKLKEVIDAAVQYGRSCNIEYRLLLPNGKEQFIHQVIDVIEEEQYRVVGTLQDISERRRAEAKIRELAYHDPVTGLANRTHLEEIAEKAVEAASVQGGKLAIVFLDLDQFKRVNDTLGHEAGDELLREVAARLLDTVRPTDIVSVPAEDQKDEKSVARLGGDEFVIVLPDLDTVDDALTVAARIITALSQPYQIQGKVIHSGGSLGVSIYPDHGSNVGELLRHADAAMYQAKALGRNRFELYQPEIDALHQKRLNTEAALHRALKNEEFELVYQPRFGIDAQTILSFEALLRWRDPENGWIAPNEFIYIAEENGLIIPIGEWVMQEAFHQLAIWQRDFDKQLGMSVNLSPVQFISDDLVGSVAEIMKNADLSPSSVELEVTENAIFKDIDTGVHIAHQLKKLDLELSIDDFGTGYSSLRLLRRLPVSTLKIDQSFIRDMLNDREDALIVESFIILGHNLGLKVVAEGVEEEGQWHALRDLGCDELQGYYFGKPCSVKDATKLLEERSLEGATKVATVT